MQVWRISKRIYADSALPGRGGLANIGRRHHRGHLIVYTSQSLSLAAWDTFVHAVPEKKPLRTYICVSVEIPDDLPVHSINEDALPERWRTVPPPIALRDVGTRWLISLSTAVARVPSVAMPGEFNYLLNPLHPDFQRIRPGEVKPFVFDFRVWKQGSTREAESQQ